MLKSRIFLTISINNGLDFRLTFVFFSILAPKHRILWEKFVGHFIYYFQHQAFIEHMDLVSIPTNFHQGHFIYSTLDVIQFEITTLCTCPHVCFHRTHNKEFLVNRLPILGKKTSNTRAIIGARLPYSRLAVCYSHPLGLCMMSSATTALQKK